MLACEYDGQICKSVIILRMLDVPGTEACVLGGLAPLPEFQWFGSAAIRNFF